LKVDEIKSILSKDKVSEESEAQDSLDQHR